MKSNIHKKMTFEDKFYRNYCCGKINHNSSWSKEKRITRKLFRTKWDVLSNNDIFDQRLITIQYQI